MASAWRSTPGAAAANNSNCTRQDLSQRRCRNVLRHAGPRHRHADRAGAGAGRDASACPTRRSGQHRQLEVCRSAAPRGGSTTVGGVSESHRRAGQDAFAKIAELVGKKLEVDPATLEAVGGRVQVDGDAGQERVVERSLHAARHAAAGSRGQLRPAARAAARSPAGRSAACRWPTSRSIRRPASSR